MYAAMTPGHSSRGGQGIGDTQGGVIAAIERLS